MIANISGADRDVDKLQTALLSSVPTALNGEKTELLSTNKKVIAAHADPPKIDSARVFEQPYFDRTHLGGSQLGLQSISRQTRKN